MPDLPGSIRLVRWARPTFIRPHCKNVGHAHPTRLPGHERTEIPDEELWEVVLQSKDGSTFEVNAKFVAPAAA